MFTGEIGGSSAWSPVRETSGLPVHVVSCRRAQVRLLQLPEARGEQRRGEPSPARQCRFLAFHVPSFGEDQATNRNLFETGGREKFRG
jgi:hypothetical protein